MHVNIKFLNLFLTFFLIVVCFSSCGPDALRKTLKPKIDQFQPKLVLDAVIASRTDENDQRLKDSLWMRISWSNPLNDLNFSIVSDAQVNLIPNGGAAINLPFDAQKNAYFLLTDPVLQVGTSYVLEVVYQGVTYTAQAVMPVLNTSIDNVGLQNIDVGFGMGTSDFLAFDFVAEKNQFYRAKALYTLTDADRQALVAQEIPTYYITVPTPAGSQFVDEGAGQILFMRRSMAENPDFVIDPELKTGDKALIQLISLDFIAWRFYNQLAQANSSFSIPFNPQNNWSSSKKDEKVLGNFSLWNVSQFEFTAQ